MRPGGNFRHDPAETRMVGDLRQDDIGENPAFAVGAAFDDRGRRLVATRLDAKDEDCSSPRELENMGFVLREAAGSID
jgi:hypothetical protein